MKKKNFHCIFGFLAQIKMTNIDIFKTNLCFRLKRNCRLNGRLPRKIKYVE